MTDFYLATVPSIPVFEGHYQHAPQHGGGSRWWPFGGSGGSPHYADTYATELTFREDITELVQDNQNTAMLATGAIVLMGGPWAMAGAALAVFSDTQEGLHLYLRVKDWMEGNAY